MMKRFFGLWILVLATAGQMTAYAQARQDSQATDRGLGNYARSPYYATDRAVVGELSASFAEAAETKLADVTGTWVFGWSQPQAKLSGLLAPCKIFVVSSERAELYGRCVEANVGLRPVESDGAVVFTADSDKRSVEFRCKVISSNEMQCQRSVVTGGENFEAIWILHRPIEQRLDPYAGYYRAPRDARLQ